MNQKENRGLCEHCNEPFHYTLIHNGFNDSAYAYSESTCYTALLDGWKIPANVPVAIQGRIKKETEAYLTPAPDGGLFLASASPRCPNCNQILDPIKAAKYIEADAEGTKAGWRWQRNWDSVYCIIIEDRIANDPYKNETEQGGSANPLQPLASGDC